MEDFKFTTKFGFELTFVPTIPLGNSSNKYNTHALDSEHIEATRKNIIRSLTKKLPAHQDFVTFVGDDEGALEINTPVFKDSKNLEKYYKIVRDVVDKYDYAPQSDVRYGGGNHIHINYSFVKKEMKNKRVLPIDLQNRPYLNWVFNEYCDDSSAESVHLSFSFSFFEPRDNVTSKKKYNINNIINKGHSIRRDHADKTVEYRIFDAPENWEQFYYQVLFLSRYLEWLKGRNPKLKVYEPSHLKELIKNDNAILKFKKLLKKLDLRYKDYRFFVEHNYERRKEAGFLTEEYDSWVRESEAKPISVLRNFNEDSLESLRRAFSNCGSFYNNTRS